MERRAIVILFYCNYRHVDAIIFFLRADYGSVSQSSVKINASEAKNIFKPTEGG